MQHLIVIILLLGSVMACATALRMPHRASFVASSNKEQQQRVGGVAGRRENKAEIMQAGLFVGPQVAFVATLVGGLIAYIAANIDDISAKQKIATDAAMKEQATNIASAQSKQQEAIRKAQESQKNAIEAARKNIR